MVSKVTDSYLYTLQIYSNIHYQQAYSDLNCLIQILNDFDLFDQEIIHTRQTLLLIVLPAF